MAKIYRIHYWIQSSSYVWERYSERFPFIILLPLATVIKSSFDIEVMCLLNHFVWTFYDTVFSAIKGYKIKLQILLIGNVYRKLEFRNCLDNKIKSFPTLKLSINFGKCHKSFERFFDVYQFTILLPLGTIV